MMTLAFGFGMIEILLLLLLTMVPAILACIDIVRHDFRGNQKLFLLLLVLFFPLLGPLLYLAVGRKQRILQ